MRLSVILEALFFVAFGAIVVGIGIVIYNGGEELWTQLISLMQR